MSSRPVSAIAAVCTDSESFSCDWTACCLRGLGNPDETRGMASQTNCAITKMPNITTRNSRCRDRTCLGKRKNIATNLTKTEPLPSHDVNRDGGTDSANGFGDWIRPITHTELTKPAKSKSHGESADSIANQNSHLFGRPARLYETESITAKITMTNGKE